MNEPITYDWLKANGFRVLTRQPRQNTDHVRRDVAAEVLGGRGFLVSSDDLCIELAHCGYEGGDWWYCWIKQVEPYRHIHVRPLRHTWEVAKLWEGLTGREWEGKGEVQ